jgi:hypothetical protein
MKPIFDRDLELAGRMAAALMAIELAALGWSNRRSDRAVAARFGVSPATVAKWRRLAVYRDAPDYWRVALRAKAS